MVEGGLKSIMRKEYSSPEIRTETVEVGVYGCYAGSNNDGPWAPIIGIWNPLFTLCCGG
jgi:hypothetical protein